MAHPLPLLAPCLHQLIYGIVGLVIPIKLHYHHYYRNFVSLVLVSLMIPLFVMPVNAANMLGYLLVPPLLLVLLHLNYYIVIYGPLPLQVFRVINTTL